MLEMPIPPLPGRIYRPPPVREASREHPQEHGTGMLTSPMQRARGISVEGSSHTGSFLGRETPFFESEPSSSETGDDICVFSDPKHVPVRIAWKGLTMVSALISACTIKEIPSKLIATKETSGCGERLTTSRKKNRTHELQKYSYVSNLFATVCVSFATMPLRVRIYNGGGDRRSIGRVDDTARKSLT